MPGLWNLLICSVTINLGAAIGTEIESIMGSSPRMWSRDKDMLYLSKRWDVQHRSYRQVLQMWETWIRSLGWKDPLEREWLCTPVFWPGESHGQRSLAGYSPWGHRVRPNFRTCTMHMRSREIWSVIGGGMGYLNWRDATWIPDSFLVLPELQHHSLPTFVSEITFNESCAKQQCSDARTQSHYYHPHSARAELEPQNVSYATQSDTFWANGESWDSGPGWLLPSLTSLLVFIL